MTISSHYYHSLSILIIQFILSLSSLISSSTALSPPPNFPNEWNYRMVNSPEMLLSTNGDFGSTYRCYAGTPSDDFRMSFCFFNTTKNAFTLALGAYPGKWAWAANPNRPVREGAAVFLLQDGNLVLYDVDGRVAWKTNTSNIGITDIKTRTNIDLYGDLVLVDANDKALWETFDHPSYTLFPNQVLHAAGGEIDKLVSYRSTLGGRYTMMMSTKGLSLYYKCANCPSPLLYYTLFKTTKTLENVKFTIYQNNTPSLFQNFADGSQSRFEFANLGPKGDGYEFVFLAWYLRIERDGNVKIFAFREDDEDQFWIEAFKVFTPGGLPSNNQETECQLPEKCGNFGVCENDKCVACPSPKGLQPWTDQCKTPVLVGCSAGANVTYYKIDGVEHFVSKYTRGQRPIVQSMCEKKCSVDCKCLGYFYHNETSECWVTTDLKTLTKSGNPKHFGYVKLTN